MLRMSLLSDDTEGEEAHYGFDCGEQVSLKYSVFALAERGVTHREGYLRTVSVYIIYLVAWHTVWRVILSGVRPRGWRAVFVYVNEGGRSRTFGAKRQKR